MIDIQALDQSGHKSCRWITQVRPTTLYCGAPVTTPRSSYCNEHHDRCWVPSRRHVERQPTALPRSKD